MSPPHLLKVIPMRKHLLLMVCGVLSVALLATLSQGKDDSAKSAPFRHVVLFKFKAEVTEAQVQEVIDAFAAMKEKIDVIQDFEYGTDVSTENKAAGFTHCFFVTFKDAKGRDTYLPHPVHKEFGKLVGPRLDKVLVVDYVAKH